MTTVLVNLSTESRSVRATNSIPAAQSSNANVPAPATAPCRADLFTPGKFRARPGGGGSFDVVVRNTGPTCLLGQPHAVSIDATDGTYHLTMPFISGSHPVRATLSEGERVTLRVKMQQIGAAPAHPRKAVPAFRLSAAAHRPVTVRIGLGNIGMPSHEALAPVNMTVAN